MRGWMVALLVVVLLVITAGVGAIAIVVSSGDDAPVVELEVGDCFDLPDDVAGDVLGSVDTVDCSEPHLAEVVAAGALNPGGDAPYPPDDELFDLVERACRVGRCGRLRRLRPAADRADPGALGVLRRAVPLRRDPVRRRPRHWLDHR